MYLPTQRIGQALSLSLAGRGQQEDRGRRFNCRVSDLSHILPMFKGAHETVHNDDDVDATTCIQTGQRTLPRSRSIAHENEGYDVNVYSAHRSPSNPEQK